MRTTIQPLETTSDLPTSESGCVEISYSAAELARSSTMNRSAGERPLRVPVVVPRAPVLLRTPSPRFNENSISSAEPKSV